MLTNYSVSSKAAPIAEILQHTGLVDEYVEYPLNLRNPFALLALRKRIALLKQDVLVYLTPARGRLKAFRDALFFRSCGIKRIIGVPYTAAQQKRQPLGNGMFEFEGARLLRCIETLGIETSSSTQAYDLAIAPSEEAEADALLGVLSDAPIIAISIGAKWDVKDWGQDNWKQLIPELAARFPGWGLVMLGAAVERERSEELGGLWRGQVINLCGSVSVRISAAVLTRSKLYIGHDSGPMHLAAAVGTPCVAIFSSQNLPGEWYPQGPDHRVIYHSIACGGCGLEICIERNKACIRSISVAEVLDTVVALAATVG